MGKYTDLKHGITKQINSQISIGLKKQDMIDYLKKEYIENGGNNWEKDKNYIIQNNKFLRSIGSIETMREAASSFCNWAYEHGYNKLEKINRDVCSQYLKERNLTKSAWTVSRDLMFCNKILDCNLTKKELGLKSRKISEVQRGRNGQDISRPKMIEAHKDHMNISKATGARKVELDRLRPSDFHRNEKGEIYEVHLHGKNGKHRDCYVRPEYRETIENILKERDKSPDEFLLPKTNKHFYTHVFRAEYAQSLLSQLSFERENNLPLFDNQYKVDYEISKHDMRMYGESFSFKGYDLDIVCIVSNQLGHNRCDVISSYLYEI